MGKRTNKLPAMLAGLDKRREEVLALLDGVDADRLDWRPRPDAWSARELVEHLVVAEKEILATRAPASPAGRGVRAAIQANLLHAILRFRVPVPVPSPGMMPTGEVAVDALAEIWRRNHRALAELVAEATADAPTHVTFAHPVAPALRLAEVISMAALHIDYHRKQLARLLAGPR